MGLYMLDGHYIVLAALKTRITAYLFNISLILHTTNKTQNKPLGNNSRLSQFSLEQTVEATKFRGTWKAA